MPQSNSISVTVVSLTKDMFSNVPDPKGDLLVRNKPRGTQGKNGRWPPGLQALANIEFGGRRQRLPNNLVCIHSVAVEIGTLGPEN